MTRLYHMKTLFYPYNNLLCLKWNHPWPSLRLKSTYILFLDRLLPAFRLPSNFDSFLLLQTSVLRVFLKSIFVPLHRPFLALWEMVDLLVLHYLKYFDHALKTEDSTYGYPIRLYLCDQSPYPQVLGPLITDAVKYLFSRGDGGTLHSNKVDEKLSKRILKFLNSLHHQHRRSILKRYVSIAYPSLTKPGRVVNV